MANQLSVVLERFGLVKFSVLQRQPDPCWHIRFRSLDGRRIVRPTKKTKHQDAIEAAAAIIAVEYGLGGKPAGEDEPTTFILWDKAIERMKKEMAHPAFGAAPLRITAPASKPCEYAFPSGLLGPNDVTDRHAGEYVERRMHTAKAVTVRGNIVKLRALWTKWFIDRLGFCGANPWDGVELPKVDKKDPRVLTDAEEVKFLKWLETKFAGWRLPVLWFQVKGFVGSRSFDITALRTEQLYRTAESSSRRKRPRGGRTGLLPCRRHFTRNCWPVPGRPTCSRHFTPACGPATNRTACAAATTAARASTPAA